MAKADLVVEKDSYMPNEVINMILSVDNSHCDKDISHIQIKLKRHIKCKNNKDSEFGEKDSLVVLNLPGVTSGN